jgi:hypothetical protein
MKVNIRHTEKSKGLVFKKKLYGVELEVQFSEEEKAIITERKLERIVLLERGVPADVDPEKHAKRGLMMKVATVAVSGRDANHFDLTFNKLMGGRIDTYWFETPVEAKNYEMMLKEETLPEAKAYIVNNEVTGSGDSFEL